MNYKHQKLAQSYIEILKNSQGASLAEKGDILTNLNFFIQNLFNNFFDIPEQIETNLRDLRKISKCNDIDAIALLEKFEFVDLLLSHILLPINFDPFINDILKTVGNLTYCSPHFRTPQVFEYFFQLIINFNFEHQFIDEETKNGLFHIFFILNTLFTEPFYPIFLENNFFSCAVRYFNISPEVNFVLLEFSEKCISSNIFTKDTWNFIHDSLLNVTEDTAEIASIIIYELFQKQDSIFNDLFFQQSILNILKINRSSSALYILKTLTRFPIASFFNNEIIKELIDESLQGDKPKLMKSALDCISRLIQISVEDARDYFFSDADTLNLVLNCILKDSFKVRLHAAITFCYILRYLPDLMMNMFDIFEERDFIVDVFSSLFEIQNDKKLITLILSVLEHFACECEFNGKMDFFLQVLIEAKCEVFLEEMSNYDDDDEIKDLAFAFYETHFKKNTDDDYILI